MALFIDQDPLLAFRPFPETTDSLLVAHWHELALATLFYSALMGLAPYVNSAAFGKFYDDMTNPKRKIDFDIHVVAMVNAIVSILLCIPMFAHPLFTSDPIFGSYDFGALACAITCGYFIWDLLYCCIYHFDLYGVQYLFHAFGALVVFGTTFLGFCQPATPAFLIFELSTPFVNLNWFFTRGPKGSVSDTTYMVNGALLLLTFFLSRCVWGVFASIKLFLRCWSSRDQIHPAFITVVFGLNLGFHYLNFTWFSKMLHIARKAKGADRPDEKKKNPESESESDSAAAATATGVSVNDDAPQPHAIKPAPATVDPVAKAKSAKSAQISIPVTTESEIS